MFPRRCVTLFAALLPLAAAASDAMSLRQALTHYASFDGGFDADFSRGDRSLQVMGGNASGPMQGAENIKLVAGAGRIGGALHFTKKNPLRPYFKGPGILDYKTADWSASVSVWLRTSPDEDLEPGYCDPVQIVAGDTKKGFIFLEWSRDERPRHFRYAIRPLMELWNPKGIDWAKLSDAERPMVRLHQVPFSRERWTHVVFTFDRINAGKAGVGKLYVDGKYEGSIEGWDLTFDWQADKVLLVLGASYVGYLDELSVFNRALTESEVRQLHERPQLLRESL